ncbi:MAG: [FeFe] hydrogenase H-cluster radical SAM maturase HydE [Deltaproteobacteria bacterium]|jgi:biotin synthase|nr:[FeFe] hydrogenase H-cluster radical SAM maturase HydE [Deltaproteobacteria bacterium]
MTNLFSLIDKLHQEQNLSGQELKVLIEGRDQKTAEYLYDKARQTAIATFGRGIYLRGLIEFTNYCRNDCLYCGLRKSNLNLERYRLSLSQILDCCALGHKLGFRTFVLQGGEDHYFDDERILQIISEIKSAYPDCALTLSLGEKNPKSYKLFYQAGADRYLLRHETRNESHYRFLHPKSMSLSHRLDCLKTLKDIGYQVGCGFMVGSPEQSVQALTEDLLFIKSFEPHMVGLGPFIPHQETPFRDYPSGSLELTLYLLSIVRLLLPKVLLPATTALGTIHPKGRELGILSGANVIMPNLSPVETRKKYALYDNKICVEDRPTDCHACLKTRLSSIGYEINVGRGDSPLVASSEIDGLLLAPLPINALLKERKGESL